MTENQAGTGTTFFGESTGHDARSLVARLADQYSVPARLAWTLIAAGAVLGILGNWLVRADGPPGLNGSVWIALVGVAALALHRRGAVAIDRERAAWLAAGVVFAAGLAWRDAAPLKLLALGSATLAFALAAHRLTAAWVRRAGMLHYAAAVAFSALHAWTAAVLALVDLQTTAQMRRGRTAGWRTIAGGIVRGLVVAAPLVLIFGALFMSADAVFEGLVTRALRFDVEWLASQIFVSSILAWLAIGYIRGFLTGTAVLPPAHGHRHAGGGVVDRPRLLTLGITEVATALAALNILFAVFVGVQFSYLFGSDSLVQITPGLTYADYARRGFFELVTAVCLVVPILLIADWLMDGREPRHVALFQALAGLQIALVLAVAASAFLRLRLYHASYGLTEPRFYALVLLIWIVAMLFWFAATVLRGRRRPFAFGTLVSGLVTVAILFVVNPDAHVARANVGRMHSVEGAVRFDAEYAMTLSADAVPVLIEALPVLPRAVQCALARHILRRWPPAGQPELRNWSAASSRAYALAKRHEAELVAMAAPDSACGESAGR